MIDRKALWFLILLCLAMTAAAVWRLSLLPDWTRMPMPTPRGPITRSGLVLFAVPLSLLFTIAALAAPKWLASRPNEALAALYRRIRFVPIVSGVLLALLQVFLISRSLRHGLGLNPVAIARIVMAVNGVLVIMQGNIMPKLPRVPSRFAALNLDPWQAARSRRFAGRMTVAFGLVLIAGAFLLPLRAILVTVPMLTLAFCGVLIWNNVRVKREPSRLP
jgi:hypothetical protein